MGLYTLIHTRLGTRTPVLLARRHLASSRRRRHLVFNPPTLSHQSPSASRSVSLSLLIPEHTHALNLDTHRAAQMASKHNSDLVMCRKQPGIAIGRTCEKCDGKCPICDSYVRPTELVRICDECNFGTYGGRCIVCGGHGISDAYYCAECVRLEKSRDGCPKIVNIGT